MILIPTFEEILSINQKKNAAKILVKTINVLHGLKNVVNTHLNLHKQNFSIDLLFSQSC